MKKDQPDPADIALGQIDGGPRAPVTHADVDYWIKRTKAAELELIKAGFRHDLAYAKLADSLLAVQAELSALQFESVSQRCHRTHNQSCHICEDLSCVDNMSEARIQIDTLRKRLQFDPGGSNRTDELEQALELLQRKQDCLKAELEELQRLMDIDAKEKASPHALARTRRGGDG